MDTCKDFCDSSPDWENSVRMLCRNAHGGVSFVLFSNSKREKPRGMTVAQTSYALWVLLRWPIIGSFTCYYRKTREHFRIEKKYGSVNRHNQFLLLQNITFGRGSRWFRATSSQLSWLGTKIFEQDLNQSQARFSWKSKRGIAFCLNGYLWRWEGYKLPYRPWC